MIALHPGDIECLTRTVWAEARNQGFKGQAAVVWVVINRTRREKGRFPRTLQGVCKAPYAFSCWLPSDPQCQRMQQVDERDPAFVDCMHAVLCVLTGNYADPTQQSDHYYAASMKHPPSWAAKMTHTVRIGDHLFFRET